MLIIHNPDDYVTETKMTTCAYHKEHPEVTNYAGCCCSASYGQRLKTPKERGQDDLKKRLHRVAEDKFLGLW